MDPFIINDEGFYYKLKNGFCTNDKLFSIEDEWESIDSFYLSFYKVTFGDSRSYEKRIQDILYIGNHNIILGFWGAFT